MGRYFGTDGFRGEANNNLTADHAYKIGRFLGWYYGEVKRRNGDDTPARIVIGKDTRRSSYMFEYTLVGGLVASGADAYLLHVTTTPSVSRVQSRISPLLPSALFPDLPHKFRQAESHAWLCPGGDHCCHRWKTPAIHLLLLLLFHLPTGPDRSAHQEAPFVSSSYSFF